VVSPRIKALMKSMRMQTEREERRRERLDRGEDISFEVGGRLWSSYTYDELLEIVMNNPLNRDRPDVIRERERMAIENALLNDFQPEQTEMELEADQRQGPSASTESIEPFSSSSHFEVTEEGQGAESLPDQEVVAEIMEVDDHQAMSPEKTAEQPLPDEQEASSSRTSGPQKKRKKKGRNYKS